MYNIQTNFVAYIKSISTSNIDSNLNMCSVHVFSLLIQSAVLKLQVTDQIQIDMVGVNGLYCPSPNLFFPRKIHNSTSLIVRITLYRLKTRSQIIWFHVRTYILQIMVWSPSEYVNPIIFWVSSDSVWVKLWLNMFFHVFRPKYMVIWC